jgi:diketogulonate reductase-like aldo/keto reductase
MVVEAVLPLVDAVATLGFVAAAGIGVRNYRDTDLERTFDAAPTDMSPRLREAVHDAGDGLQSALTFAQGAGLSVFTSASLAQGDLVREIPASVADRLAGETTAQQALNFARSGPGVTASLVGMATPAHVEENIAAGSFQPMGADAFDATFE